MEFKTPEEPKKRSFYRCASRETVVKLRKILVTGASIYFLLYKLEEFYCPNYISEIESYQSVSNIIEDRYVKTLEKYLMDNAEYYHLTQVFSYDQKELDLRFHILLRYHYTYFDQIEDTKQWDAELIAEIKNNFTQNATDLSAKTKAIKNDTFLTDKVILYQIQEMVAKQHNYYSSFFMEIGMNDFLRNYSTQALVIWYHWRGMILETDIVALHNYVQQPTHTTVLCPTAICTDDNNTRGFHYLILNRNALRPQYRDHFRALYRVPCFHLSTYGNLFRSEHIEYFIVGPQCDLMPTLKTIVKQKNVHFILVILKKTKQESSVKSLLESEYFSLYYNSKSLSKHYVYLLFFKFIERGEHRRRELPLDVVEYHS